VGILSSIISFIKKIPKFIARLRLTLFKPNISDAAKNGDLPLVEAWINVGVSFYEFIFALREAADRGNLAIVNRLLAERLAIINITFSPEELEKMEQSGTRYSSSCHPIHILGFPLLAAARRGHMDVVNRLLELIDINNGHEDSHDKDLFYKAINEAVSNNQVAIVRRLIDFSNNDCLRSALRSAIVHNQTDIFFMLLPDWSMASKTFPLWPFALMGPNEFYLRDFLKEAAKHAQMPIIEKLLSMLNAVVSSDDNIKQIFKIAIEHYNLGVVKDLLPYLLEDSEILCSEMLNAMRHGHLEVVKLLMKISTVAEQVYLNSVFYLQAAIEHDQVFIFAELLDIQDVRKNLTNDDVTKLLNIAVEADIKYKNEKEQRGCRNSQGTYTWYEYPNAKKDTNLHNYVYLIIRSLYPRYNDMPLQIRDIVCPYMRRKQLHGAKYKKQRL
jgi:ankyrin repeat protein